jgi:hypothetical protein
MIAIFADLVGKTGMFLKTNFITTFSAILAFSSVKNVLSEKKNISHFSCKQAISFQISNVLEQVALFFTLSFGK